VSDYAKALREAHRVSRCCTFILEWQHRQEDFGPPVDHRLTQEFIKDLSRAIGYRSVTVIPLDTLILYELHK
jgi:hypothetical protein